jgi:hypothetical protein
MRSCIICDNFDDLYKRDEAEQLIIKVFAFMFGYLSLSGIKSWMWRNGESIVMTRANSWPSPPAADEYIRSHMSRKIAHSMSSKAA